MPLDPSGNLELEQHGTHNCGGGARELHQIVDRYWRGTEKRDEATALLVTGLLYRLSRAALGAAAVPTQYWARGRE
jgi:hypothetical protein